MSEKTAVIIGAGPAGLTAAYELLDKTDIRPIVYEMSPYVGGISKTVNYRGNRIDIGGHRFFSKSDRVMEWWLNILPLQEMEATGEHLEISYQNRRREITSDRKGPDPETEDRVMLVRSRLSRILFLGRFFDYPISLNLNTIRNLGPIRMLRIGVSYFRSLVLPVRPEETLEHFFINRFGRELYQTFFKDYTEKVWGVPCSQIEASWGAQRIKRLSVSRALLHALRSLIRKDGSLDQKGTETSLIERFIYPKYGPGQMWEEVARKIREKGGEIHHGYEACGLELNGEKVRRVQFRSTSGGDPVTTETDYVISTMPVRDLVAALGDAAPTVIRDISRGLEYRDFITVGVLLRRLDVGKGKDKTNGNPVSDNWIYVQEPHVRLGRIQIFNNWSPYMVSDPDRVWIGLEYFCNEGDDLWSMTDEQLAEFAVSELEQIQFARREEVLDSTVIRQPKAYPGYFGSYNRFSEIREYLDTLANLFLVGRNGMHKYNNQDHSMLTAMAAVENIRNQDTSKEAVWSVNAEQEYHEGK